MFHVVCLILLCVSGAFCWDQEEARYPPHYVLWYGWLECVSNQHLTQLTAEIYADAAMKMRTIKANSAIYETKSMFVIGTLASNAYTLFEKMIKIYQNVSSIHKVRNADWGQERVINDSLMAFGICQSLYHQIRLEKRLFQEVLQQQAKEVMQKNEEFTKMYGQPPAGAPTNVIPKYHRAGGWNDQARVIQSHKHLHHQLSNLLVFPLSCINMNHDRGGMYAERRSHDDDLIDEDDFDSHFQLPILLKNKDKSKILYQPPGEKKDKKLGSSTTRLPHNPYAPQPFNETPSDLANIKKIVDSLPLSIPNVSNMLPYGFPDQPSNSKIQKLMSQLNKDNPHLNPDLGTFLRGSGHRITKSDREDAIGFLIESGGYSAQSRRMGSYNYPRSQQPSLESNSNSAQSRRLGSDNYPRSQRPSLESNSYSAQSRRLGSDNYPRSQRPSLESNRYSAQLRRLGSNNYPKSQRPSPESNSNSAQSQRMGSYKSHAIQPPKRSGRNHEIQPPNSDNYGPIQRLSLHPDGDMEVAMNSRRTFDSERRRNRKTRAKPILWRPKSN